MTVTIEIKDEKVDQFWQLVAEHDLAAEDIDLARVEESHIQEILRRDQDPFLSQSRPWAEARQQYVGKGL